MKNIPFSPPDYTEKEIEAVAEAMRSGWITTGPRTKEFEKHLQEYLHCAKVVCLNSCTAAEELHFHVLEIHEGDEVIVPAYTYTASASAAIHCGAKVVFVDSQKDSVEMDYDAMEAAINERTKAIVPVDLGGVVCNYDRIYKAIENKKHLFKPYGKLQKAIGRVAIVADCAHALGATRNGKMAGEIADFSSFSFHAVKNLTTAEGGAACWNSIDGINDEELYHEYQLLSLHGQSKDALAKNQLGAWEYDVIAPLYKCNMTDIMAAIGLAQMVRYPSLLARRKEIVAKYDAACDALGIKHIVHQRENFESSRHLYLIHLPDFSLEKRNAFIAKMAERGVACNVHYKPLPMMTAYKAYGWDIKDFPNAYALFENEVTLPLHTKLTDEDVEYICKVMKNVYKELA